MQIFGDYQLTVLGLTETWHDTDSPVFGRCRMAGFSVVDRPRVRVRDDLSVNHGGVAIVAAPGTLLSPLPTGSPSSTFEVVAAHMTGGRSRAAIAVVYRPGSQPVTAQFFDDLSALLERLVVLRLPLFVTGDFNVRLDHDTHHAEQLRSVFEAFGRDLRIVFLRSNRITNRIGRPIRFRIEFSNRIGRIYQRIFNPFHRYLLCICHERE